MKKKIALILAVCLCIGALATGCGNNNNQKQAITVPEYNVDDYVTLGDYKGLEIKYTQKFKVSDQEVEDQIKTILGNYTEYKESKKTVVEKGDYINMDYVGKINGEEFQGGKATGTEITVGSAGYISGFEDQLVGKKVGTTFDINVTFPENYGKDELNGKPAVFTITINSIKEKVTPTLNEEFVKKVSTQSKTVAEFKKEVKDSLQAQRDKAVQSYKQYQAEALAIENAKVEKFPTNYVEKLMEDYKESVRTVAEKNNKSYTDYIKETFGFDTEDAFNEQLKAYMEQTAKINLVLEAIQKKENINPSEDELKKAMEDYAKEQGYDSLEDFLKVIEEPELKKYIIQIKVLDFVTESATIVEP